ncbi:MAG: choice-of-anchor B domain-containing protein [Saprospiraceae bacterium]|jgi:choice-of-anchor B domain-containing protein
MTRTLTLLLLSFIAYSGFSQLNMTYVGNITYNQNLSDIWGYVAPDDTEYGLVGVFNGVSVVSLADPSTPTEADFVDGIGSTWRDIKTWNNFAYVINESGNGLAVIDLSGLPTSVTSTNWTPDIPGFGTLSTCHNIFIDEFGYAYIAGCNLNGGGVLILNVDTPDGMPEFVAAMPNEYSHDIYVRSNLAYSSEINAGHFSIYDVADKENIQTLGQQNTPFNFTHNAWPSDDETILFTTDEQANAPVASYDISDPNNIQELDQFKPYETLGDGVIPHNVHVWNDWLIVSYYTDGCILVDGSHPENLVEVGNFDTFIPASTGFSGAWGAYPFLPSGLVLVSDIGNGMYVLQPNYVRACWLEGNITDATNNNAIIGASVEILTTNVFETSGATGGYKTGFATAGTYDILIKKPGYEPFNGQAVLENDVVTLLDAALTPLPSFSLSGAVTDANDGTGVPNALVSVSNEDFSFDIQADANGNFVIPAIFEGDYNAYAGIWGYKTSELTGLTLNQNNPSFAIEIEEGIEDVFSLDLGWETSFSGVNGPWERGKPIGVFVAGPDIYITPPNDVSEDIGNSCYVTGNTSDLFDGVLIGGDASLTSPLFDLTNYDEPFMSFSFWYLNVDPNNGNAGFSDFFVQLDNGTESVIVDTVSFEEFGEISWELSEFDIAEYITPTNSMTVTFTATSPVDFTEITEAGVDFFRVWDASLTDTKELVDHNILLQAYPNPSAGDFVIRYDLQSTDNNSKAMIYNTLGQLLEIIALTDSKGQLTVGSQYEQGIYFAHIKSGSAISKSLKLIKQ